ncbi:MAG: LOG family protein [bacterium]|nr:LOG family protein [bacterium]
MDSLLCPDRISGTLQIKEIEDLEDDHDTLRAQAVLTAPVSQEFIDRWVDCTVKVANTRVNAALLGVEVHPYLDDAEFHRYKNMPRGRITIPALITQGSDGLRFDGLQESLAPLDALVAKIIITNPDEEIIGSDREDLIRQILERAKDDDGSSRLDGILDPLNSTFSIALADYIAELRDSGIDGDDVRKFVFGLRFPEVFDTLVKRIQIDPALRYRFETETDVMLSITGFTHEDAIGVFGDGEKVKPTGTRVVFPRGNRDVYIQNFLMRLRLLAAAHLDELVLPIKFYRSNRRALSVASVRNTNGRTFEDMVEAFAKLDLEIANSYPSTRIIFELLSSKQGGRKAILLRDEEDYRRIAKGDLSRIKSFTPLEDAKPVNLIARAEDPTLPEYKKVENPNGYAELKAVSEIEPNENGILFCKYFPNKDVLRRLHAEAGKLRAIVFEAPTYERAPSVRDEEAEYPLEAHIFFGPEEYIALREFHYKYPDIKIIWSHPGVRRNLIFVDDGKIPMFAKPEVAGHLLDPEGSVRISFCGSSTVREMSRDERNKEEMAYTKVYCDHAKSQGKTPIGINGGGPEVMERNGSHLQQLGAVSVSSACDLGFAGQKRHLNWDAVMNLAGDSTSFALREEVLIGGDIVHIAPGGIGSIQEVLGVLAQNKLGMAYKTIILVGKDYWKGQIQQMIDAAKEGNISARYLEKLFVVDSPEDVQTILTNLDSDETYVDQRKQLWTASFEAGSAQGELFDFSAA